LRRLKKSIHPSTLLLFLADQSNISELENVVATAIAKFGHIDLLINNAALVLSIWTR
jgi:NAD(P)-dependent dehydrogenase (short-subunit alcohol dehydrogenase family)